MTWTSTLLFIVLSEPVDLDSVVPHEHHVSN